MTPRDKIITIRDYEAFLKSRGFTGTESKILARAWRDLARIGQPRQPAAR
jgi:hypothetical protein